MNSLLFNKTLKSLNLSDNQIGVKEVIKYYNSSSFLKYNILFRI